MRLRPLAALVAALAAALACDAGLEPEPVCEPGLVGACGTARFSGLPPAMTEAVYVVAFPTFPQTCSDLLEFPPKFRPFPPSGMLPPYPDSARYSMPLLPDTYAWVVAVWKKQGQLTFTVEDTALFRVAGDYRDPGNPTQRGAVTVPGGGAVGNVDVAVDFGTLQPVPDVVPCTGP